MTDKKSNDSRRKLLKSIAAGSGAVVAGKSLPEAWTKPVVDSVLLPAHAATTNEVLTNTSFYTPPPPNFDSDGTGMLDALISPAMADEDPDIGMLITLSVVGGKVVANSQHMNIRRRKKYTASNIPTDNTASPTPLNKTECGQKVSKDGHTHIKIVDYTFDASTISVEITYAGDGNGIRPQTLNTGSGSIALECGAPI